MSALEPIGLVDVATGLFPGLLTQDGPSLDVSELRANQPMELLLVDESMVMAVPADPEAPIAAPAQAASEPETPPQQDPDAMFEEWVCGIDPDYNGEEIDSEQANLPPPPPHITVPVFNEWEVAVDTDETVSDADVESLPCILIVPPPDVLPLA